MNSDVMALFLIAITVGIIGWGLPTFRFSPSSIKNTGGCGISCFRALAFATTYCSGVVSNGMIMQKSGGTIKLNYAINVQISNFTGAFIEVQADLIDAVTNNNYLTQGFCGTFKGGSPQEFGIALYFPIKSQFFGLSAVIDYPINSVLSNALVGGTTYYASISLRPFAVNGTSMGGGSGSVNTRMSTITTNGIGLLETS